MKSALPATGQLGVRGLTLLLAGRWMCSWWMLAAKQGHARAQYAAGEAYISGSAYRNGHRDFKSGFPWLLRAAQSHVPQAEMQVGDLMLHGDGVIQDEESGVEWLQRASALPGLPTAAALRCQGEAAASPAAPRVAERVARRRGGERRRRHRGRAGRCSCSASATATAWASTKTRMPRATSSTVRSMQVRDHVAVWLGPHACCCAGTCAGVRLRSVCAQGTSSPRSSAPRLGRALTRCDGRGGVQSVASV